MTAAIVIALILTLVCTILSLIFITPDKKREGLNPFFKFLHDLFNFRWLLVEKILKFLYVFSTIMCIFLGFVLLFESFGGGLALIFLGPIGFRFLFESLMMFVLIVKNVIAINNKMGGSLTAPAAPQAPAYARAPQPAPAAPRAPQPAPAAPRAPQPGPAPAQPQIVYCGQCGARYDKSQGPCPNCGHRD